ncbi:MAG: carboxypeptidase-like regulatory domain-containing protein [Armatimonadota bacterium]|nr:carboxypeptidase-like regulatory domain-containing protein [Armatimonadota bacterium]
MKDRDDEAPLAKALVVVMAERSVVATGHTKPDGTWTGQVAGQVTVVAAKTLHIAQTRTITVEADQPAQLTFKLRRQTAEDFKKLGRIVGFVKDADGKALAKATLVLLKRDEEKDTLVAVGASQPKNATGIYELQWYPPGTYTVLATAAGHKPVRYEDQQISAGESLWLDVTLQKQ